MKNTQILYVLVATVVWGTAPATAAAQGVDDVARAKAQLEAAGVSLATRCGATMLSNLVAWNLRGAGDRPAFGLLHKTIGNRAVLRADGSCLDGETTNDPDGFATDYVIERASGAGFDILTSWLAPAWQGPETAFTARNWSDFRDPVDPAPYLTHATPAPASGPTPPAVVVVPAAPACDLGPIARQLEQLAATLAEHVRADGDAHAAIHQNITDARAEARPALEALKTIGGWIAKYGLPAVGGWLAARHLS